MTGAHPFATGGGLAPDGGGGVWCAAPRSARVALLRAGTVDTIAQTTVDIPNVIVGSDERAAEIARVEKVIAKYTSDNFDKSKTLSTKPGIAALHTDNDGRLWVQRAKKFNRNSTTFDLFDARGRHLARIALPVKQSTAMPVRARGNPLWLAVLDDDDVKTIVQFRIGN